MSSLETLEGLWRARPGGLALPNTQNRWMVPEDVTKRCRFCQRALPDGPAICRVEFCKVGLLAI